MIGARQLPFLLSLLGHVVVARGRMSLFPSEAEAMAFDSVEQVRLWYGLADALGKPFISRWASRTCASLVLCRLKL